MYVATSLSERKRIRHSTDARACAMRYQAGEAVVQRYSEAHQRALRALLEKHSVVHEGRMFGHPAWFVGRRMFACVYGDGVGIKVPSVVAAELLTRSDIVPFQPYGKARMREWVQINRQCSEDYYLDLEIFEAAIRYADPNASDD